MPTEKYVVVTDTPSKLILAGPFIWDSEVSPDWQPPVAGQMMTVQAARAGGYTDAPPPVTEQNARTLQQRARQALNVNATFLAITTPTAAQVTNQVQNLTKECTALIRLMLNELDSTSGT